MITPIYAAIFGLFFVFLSFCVIKQRAKNQVTIGGGQHPELMRTMRVHGNFAEYVPLALLLLFFLETQTNHSAVIHALGLALLAGRVIHMYGISKTNEDLRFRKIGMVLTLTVIILSAIKILFSYI